MITEVTTAYQLVSKHGIINIMQNQVTGEKSVFSTAFFDADEQICHFSAEKTLPEPSYLTIQIGEGAHITLLPGFLQFTNHSCSPNVFFDTTSMKLIALVEIQPGDEMVFFYPSTEWEMAQPFSCFCGAVNCLGQIKGAIDLTEETIIRYRFTEFIQEKLKSRKQP